MNVKTAEQSGSMCTLLRSFIMEFTGRSDVPQHTSLLQQNCINCCYGELPIGEGGWGKGGGGGGHGGGGVC